MTALKRGQRLLQVRDQIIRMLDADGYPHAFVRHGDLRLELRHAVREGDAIRADVRIVRRSEGDE